jgi:hypothetical protein
MKLTLNKKKLKNLSKDAQILPNNMTPNVGGGGTNHCQSADYCTTGVGYTDGCATNNCNSDMTACGTVITDDVFCDATGSCGCDSAGRNCTDTNTCM